MPPGQEKGGADSMYAAVAIVCPAGPAAGYTPWGYTRVAGDFYAHLQEGRRRLGPGRLGCGGNRLPLCTVVVVVAVAEGSSCEMMSGAGQAPLLKALSPSHLWWNGRVSREVVRLRFDVSCTTWKCYCAHIHTVRRGPTRPTPDSVARAVFGSSRVWRLGTRRVS